VSRNSSHACGLPVLKRWYCCHSLFAGTESEAVSARQLHNKNVRLSSARQPQPANINCTEARQPRPGVKCSQVTDGLSDREIEIQQQRYISCLINSKSSSSRLQRRHAPPHSIDVKQSLASASDDVTSWRLTHWPRCLDIKSNKFSVDLPLIFRRDIHKILVDIYAVFAHCFLNKQIVLEATFSGSFDRNYAVEIVQFYSG